MPPFHPGKSGCELVLVQRTFLWTGGQCMEGTPTLQTTATVPGALWVWTWQPGSWEATRRLWTTQPRLVLCHTRMRRWCLALTSGWSTWAATSSTTTGGTTLFYWKATPQNWRRATDLVIWLCIPTRILLWLCVSWRMSSRFMGSTPDLASCSCFKRWTLPQKQAMLERR